MHTGRATEGEIAEVRQLFLEYRSAVNAAADAKVCFASFEHEVAELPEGYLSILVAREADQLCGCVALRALGEGACEMKRLFVQPAYQGRGLGRALVEAALREARTQGFHVIRLDTLPTMGEAIRLYRAMGFREIARYNDNPDARALYFERELD